MAELEGRVQQLKEVAGLLQQANSKLYEEWRAAEGEATAQAALNRQFSASIEALQSAITAGAEEFDLRDQECAVLAKLLDEALVECDSLRERVLALEQQLEQCVEDVRKSAGKNDELLARYTETCRKLKNERYVACTQ